MSAVNPIVAENVKRAERARAALEHYKATLLGESGEPGEDEVTDLLADILHAFGRPTLEWAPRMAGMHYEAEVASATLRVCGHSACSQYFIDTGSRECVLEEKP